MFVRAPNPIWYFVNLDGLQLDDTYYISYLENTLPYLPQFVYMDNQGITPWSDPIQFLPNGTLPDNIYFDPDLVYRLEIRQGPTQSSPLIYVINDFVPSGSITPVTTTTSSQENQITNPQFAFINFISPLSISVAGTYTIAPGWQLVLTGSGTCTVTQLIFNASENLPNEVVPPYAIRINTAGWTTAVLQQQFNGVGGIWANTFVSMSIVARSDNSTPNNISLVYSPNSPSNPYPITITTQPLTTGTGYDLIQGIIALPTANDTTPNSSAFVDMQIILPTTGIVDLSNVQVMGQETTISVPFLTQPDETLERQTDHLYHFYQSSLFYKQVPSYLVGWDFPLNPSQFVAGRSVSAQAVGANKSYYIWDQTIAFQSANSAITVSNGVFNSLKLTAAATTKMAIIQYLEPNKLNALLSQPLSVNLSAACILASAPSIPVTISLWYTTGSLPSTIGSNNSIVATLDANGKPATFNGSWTEITRDNLQNALCNVVPVTNGFADYNFSGWNTVASNIGNTATFFAIVIGTGSIATADSISFNSVGLMGGSIATRPAPQTQDEVLKECQRYFAKTFPFGVAPGQNVTTNGQVGYNAYHSGTALGGSYIWKFPSSMYTTPIITTASPLSASTAWYNITQGTQSDVVAISDTCTDSTHFSNFQVSGDAIGDFIAIQASADARLGQ